MLLLLLSYRDRVDDVSFSPFPTEILGCENHMSGLDSSPDEVIPGRPTLRAVFNMNLTIIFVVVHNMAVIADQLISSHYSS